MIVFAAAVIVESTFASLPAMTLVEPQPARMLPYTHRPRGRPRPIPRFTAAVILRSQVAAKLLGTSSIFGFQVGGI